MVFNDDSKKRGDNEEQTKRRFNDEETPGFSSDVVSITPAKARKWLEKNHPRNRPVSWSRVEAFANDMLDGNWRLTHQGICFDGDGFLVDGQTRLVFAGYSDGALRAAAP